MQLTTDDRDAGLEAPDGRRFRPDGNGVITLPEELAAYGARAARVTPPFHVRRRGWGGFDAAEVRARYGAWEGIQADRAPAEGIQPNRAPAEGTQPNHVRLGPDGEPKASRRLGPDGERERGMGDG